MGRDSRVWMWGYVLSGLSREKVLLRVIRDLDPEKKGLVESIVRKLKRCGN